MPKRIVLKIVILSVALATAGLVEAGDQPTFILEVEAGPTWQSSNDVQVPNTLEGTRFSLKDLAGQGPWIAGRVYFTWNISPRNAGMFCSTSTVSQAVQDAPSMRRSRLVMTSTIDGR